MRGWVWGALFAAVLAAPPAWAHRDPDLPPIDGPKHWHKLTHDDATSTSRCLGRPDTPLCAVETVQACFMRRTDEYCRYTPEFAQALKGLPPIRESRRYWVTAAERVSQTRTHKIFVGSYADPLPGDVIIAVDIVACFDGRCGKRLDLPIGYLLRKTEGGWRAVTWEAIRK